MGVFASSEKSHLSAQVRWRLLSNYLCIMHTVLLVLKSEQLIANQI